MWMLHKILQCSRRANFFPSHAKHPGRSLRDILFHISYNKLEFYSGIFFSKISHYFYNWIEALCQGFNYHLTFWLIEMDILKIQIVQLTILDHTPLAHQFLSPDCVNSAVFVSHYYSLLNLVIWQNRILLHS